MKSSLVEFCSKSICEAWTKCDSHQEDVFEHTKLVPIMSGVVVVNEDQALQSGEYQERYVGEEFPRKVSWCLMGYKRTENLPKMVYFSIGLSTSRSLRVFTGISLSSLAFILIEIILTSQSES